MIIKGVCNGIPFTVERFPSLMGFEPKTAISGAAPILPCKIIASHKKTLTYQIKKNSSKKENSSFRIEEDRRTRTGPVKPYREHYYGNQVGKKKIGFLFEILAMKN